MPRRSRSSHPLRPVNGYLARMKLPGRRLALLVHAITVLALLALFLAAAAHGGPDANVGLGLVGLPLLALGLPWSLPYLLDSSAYEHATQAVGLLAVLGPAVFNVVIHALVVWLRGRA